MMDQTERTRVLSDLVKINSVNGNELEVANYLRRLFGQHGLTADVQPFGEQRANLIVEVGAGKPILGITGHMDTVALGDEGKWRHAPLSATIEGDRLYGRGAADMKSGLAAQVIALIELVESGTLTGHVRFIATAGEEYGTPGANRLEEAGVAKDLDALVVGEPTSGNVIYAHSGSYNYRIVSTGQAVHSSEPERGQNALEPLVDFALAERDLFFDVPDDPCLGPLKHSVTIIQGGEQVNTIPDYAELRGNIRPTLRFDNDHVTARLQAAVDRLNQEGAAHLTLEVLHSWRPVASDPNGDFVKRALQASQKAFAKYPGHATPELGVIHGATDASVFVRHNHDLPVILLGADDWNISHQVNEYTTLSSFEATIEAYKRLIPAFFE
ncbi:succinyl-diaminopimelate desuccinylase [Limosilactobacillus fermentum]|nr:succinyl-diaminopimelate desuccinylase [Limosilactobacillus fermentum]PPX65972.1 succinyl-diaminopimelate desuccinylase [Limosilactobacillus fermentum]